MFDLASFFAIETLADGVALAAGLIATVFCIAAFQAKNRRTILVIQMIGMCLWVVHFLLKGNYAGAAMNGLAVIRSLVYVRRGRSRWADSRIIPAFFIALFIGAGIATYYVGGEVDRHFWFLPVIAMTITSIGLFCKNEQTVRVINLFSSPPWIAYNTLCRSAPAIFTETFTMVSVFIALLRYRTKKSPGGATKA